MPGSASPLFAGSAAMRPDRGAVDHLQHVGIAAAVRQCLQKHVPHARETPATELLVHRVPVAQHLRQVAPRSAGAADPKHPSSTLRWSFGGRPPSGEGLARKGAKIAHSWSVIRPRITANLQHRGQPRNHIHTVSGNRRATIGRRPIRAGPSQFFSQSLATVPILLLPAPVQSTTEYRQTRVCPQGLDYADKLGKSAWAVRKPG